MTEIEAYEWLKEEIKKYPEVFDLPVIDGVVVEQVGEMDKHLLVGKGVYPTYMWQKAFKLSLEDVEKMRLGEKTLDADIALAKEEFKKAVMFVYRVGFLDGVGIENDTEGIFKNGCVIKVSLPRRVQITLPWCDSKDKMFGVLYVGSVSHLLPREGV